jgi:hypothetical protein
VSGADQAGCFGCSERLSSSPDAPPLADQTASGSGTWTGVIAIASLAYADGVASTVPSPAPDTVKEVLLDGLDRWRDLPAARQPEWPDRDGVAAATAELATPLVFAGGRAILASNRLSFSDSIFLPLVLRRPVTFLAKSNYFAGRGLKGRLTAGFFKGLGQVPVDRSGGQVSEAAPAAARLSSRAGPPWVARTAPLSAGAAGSGVEGRGLNGARGGGTAAEPVSGAAPATEAPREDPGDKGGPPDGVPARPAD